MIYSYSYEGANGYFSKAFGKYFVVDSLFFVILSNCAVVMGFRGKKFVEYRPVEFC